MTRRDRKDPDSQRTGPRSIASVLEDVVGRMGLGRDLDDFRVWDAWDEIVGDTVARNARPIRLDGKRLVVAVKNNTWMQELSMLRDDIAARLNAWMGREIVGEIFLVAGRLDDPPTKGAGRAAPRPAPGPRQASEALDRLWKKPKDR